MKVSQLRGFAETLAKAAPALLAPAPAAARTAIPPERMAKRSAHLAEGGRRPSRTELERLLGTNDLVDLNYLGRGLAAARSVCRLILRDASGRPIGHATGFKVSPSVLITNYHVLPTPQAASQTLAEFDFDLDLAGRQRPTTCFALAPERFYLSDQDLDTALVAIVPEPVSGAGSALDAYGYLRMNPEIAKINPEVEFVSIIQHPQGLPKQVSIRENQLLRIEGTKIWYRCDTAQGSSGAPVLNDSWQVVGLHHSGVPATNAQGDWLRKDGQPAQDEDDDSEVNWIANAGIRVSSIVAFAAGAEPGNPHLAEFLRCARTDAPPEVTGDPVEWHGAEGRDAGQRPTNSPVVEQRPGGARITVPISLDVAILSAVPLRASAAPPAPRLAAPAVTTLAAVERLVMPFAERDDYSNREGYDEDFLDPAGGLPVPLPVVRDPGRCAPLLDGSGSLLDYHNFSIEMDAKRRLALYTASNVDGSKAAKEPEPGKNYSRAALGGLGKNDKELWFIDERIAPQHQLPDRFFTKDRNAFDRGHLVRREDVCWGSSWRRIRAANGDTYHTTNCSPQVMRFNQSKYQGKWGLLENMVLRQAESERLCVFAGPVLSPRDRLFSGEDDDGPVEVKIPSRFWKVVVARQGNRLQSFGFLLKQNLRDVAWEFQVDEGWEHETKSIAEIEEIADAIDFPDEVRKADQHPG
ncbi:MAG TPA: DNA/RNA non-specific endonuclease [Acetobacteraceae bacterium]|nr:DNA/RNA non-specific endonuclease [Acetobacteraceae bacterium]